MTRRVFVTEYVGLATRLEALAMAYLISDYYGHEVCIDWKELDALHVVGAQVRGRRLAGRIGALKLRGNVAPEELYRVATHRNVNLRTHQGPAHVLSRYYLPTAQRVRLRLDLVDAIRAGFAPHAGRPIVGVHIRRGDFPLVDPNTFDANAAEWPATPDWWYEHVMAEIQRAVPDVVFYVSCSGSLADFPNLTQRFPVFEIDTRSTYAYRGPGHASVRHPAADLFALGCCRTLIGSSCSTFSHYAANMLGEPTTVLLPPPRTSAAAPAFTRLSMHGRGATDWYQACRTGAGLEPLDDASTLSLGVGACVDWM